jgi:hypothetical protein
MISQYRLDRKEFSPVEGESHITRQPSLYAIILEMNVIWLLKEGRKAVIKAIC